MFLTLDKSINYSGYLLFGLSVGIFNLLKLYFEFNKPLEIGFFNEIELPDKLNNQYPNKNLYEDKTLLLEENGNEYNL